MNTHVAPTPALPGPSGHFARNTLIAAVGGSAILVAVFAAVVFARGGSDESPRAAAPAVAPAAVAPAIEAKGATLSAIAAGYAAARRPIYLVSSEEQATLVRAGIDDSNAILGALNEPLQLASVMVVGIAIQDETLFQSVMEGNATLRALGLPEKVIVDLRQ